MFLRMILVTIMGILLLGWVIFCGIQWIRQGKRAVFYGDFTGHIKCEKCGREYTVSRPELAKGSMVRSKEHGQYRDKRGHDDPSKKVQLLCQEISLSFL